MLVNSVFAYGTGVTPSEWEFHNSHPSFSRLYYIHGGTAFYRDAERSFRFEPGKLYLLPADRVYSMWEDKDDKSDHLYVHLLTTPKVAAPIVRDPKEDRFLADLTALLETYVTDNAKTNVIRRIAEALVLYITDDSEQAGRLSLKIRAHLDESYREAFSAEELARMFGYSPSYLYKVFKHDFGVSPKRYHADRRFEYAARCLVEGIPGGTIAEALGYTSSANFSRDFKKRFGLSPHEYARWLPRG